MASFKDGKIVDDLQGNSSIYAGEFEDYMIAKFMLGYGFDLGVDYHYSASIVPFFSLGYDDSRGSTHIDAVNLYFASNRFTTVIRTFHISAGIYF